MITESEPILTKKNQESPIKQILFALLSGILMAAAFSIPSLDLLAWFALIPLIFSFYHYETNAKTGLKLSFIFGMTYYLGLITWLFRLHPLTWAGFTEGESLLILTAGWLAFSLLEAIGLSFAGLFIGIVKPQGINRIIVPVCLWVFIEWLQGLTEFGFTWGRLAISQNNNLHLIQSVNLFGTLFISALIVFTNATIAVAITDYLKHKKYNYRALTTMVVILFINTLYGFYVINTKVDDSKDVNAAIIQGNILSDQKWNMTPQAALDIYTNVSKQLFSDRKGEKIDIVVWPESAVRDYLGNPYIDNQLKRFSIASETYLFTGIFTLDTPIERIMKGEKYSVSNSMIAINPKGKILGIYSKRHLVPFGEYIPFRSFLQLLMPKIAHMNALGHDLSPGTDAGIISTPFGKVGGLVCYESIFPQITRKSIKEGAELLILVTNDSWFKDSRAVYQHEAQSVFRSIENDRYMVRAANTGISTIIAPDGRILTELGALKKGFITGKVKFRNTITLYSQIGDIIAILAFILLLLIYLKNRTKNVVMESK